MRCYSGSLRRVRVPEPVLWFFLSVLLGIEIQLQSPISLVLMGYWYDTTETRFLEKKYRNSSTRTSDCETHIGCNTFINQIDAYSKKMDH